MKLYGKGKVWQFNVPDVVSDLANGDNMNTNEEAPTNATGGSVPGTGDDKSTVKIKKKKKAKILKRLKGTYECGKKPDKELEFWKTEDRNYRKEYDNYHAKPEQREKNAARLRARRLMVKKGKVKKHDKMDVHHKDNNPLNNDPKNLSVTTQKYNRTEPRLREEGEQAPTPDLTPDSTFAQMPVFKVNQDDFAKCQNGKKKHAHWNKHIDTESDYGKKIHGYAKKNPKSPIIVQDDKSGHMVYLKKYSQLEK
jgi:hypothetical protein